MIYAQSDVQQTTTNADFSVLLVFDSVITFMLEFILNQFD